MGEAIPSALGPYRIDGVLGRGGMGVVYRGTHVGTGEQAALKTVLAASDHMLASIRREMHALSRIRHSSVVRIMMQGVTDGLPWYAMELLAGRTLEDHLDDLWRMPLSAAPPASHEDTIAVSPGERAPAERAARRGASTREPEALRPSEIGVVRSPSAAAPSRAVAPEAALTVTMEMASPPNPSLPSAPPPAPSAPPPAPPAAAPRRASRPLAPVLGLICRLCRALAFLHASGIVHRDLKPSNIFIRPDGTPVLADFGLAARFIGEDGRESLDFGGAVEGSAPYMSPEQIHGEIVDARSDLYALGCILYECATGETPFSGPTPLSIVLKHLDAAPRPPSELAEGIPPALEHLILKLLEKSPQHRFGYAQDVADALAPLCGEPDTAPMGASPLYLYRPRLLGRDDLMRWFDGELDHLRVGRGRRVFLAGESGVGKTRLAMEVATVAARSSITVVTGQCVALGVAGARGDASVRAAPLHPLRPLLSAVLDRCRIQGAAGVERLLGPRAAMLAVYEPSLLELCRSSGPAAAISPSPAHRDRVLAALKETLFALAADRPLLLVLDDLQWADELSLRFLKELTDDALERRGVLVLGTYRTEEAGEALAALACGQGAVRFELGRLDRSILEEIVGDMLALQRAPSAFVELVTHASGGNPFFLAEYLRAAIAEGLIARDGAGRWRVGPRAVESNALHASLGLPRSLAELIGKRLAGAGDCGKRLARLAAVIGREVDEAVLLKAAELDEDEALDALSELRARDILEEDGTGRLRFVHDKLRELAYDAIDPVERSALHERVGLAIESLYPAERRIDRYEALAHHFGRSLQIDKAADYAERAADKAAAAFALDEARVQYQRAIDYLARLGGGAEIQRRRVDVVIRWSDACLYEPSAAHVEVLLATRAIAAGIGYPEGALRCEYGASWLAYAVGEHERSKEIAARAVLSAIELGDWKLRSQLLLIIGQNRANNGEHEEAHARIEEGLELREAASGHARTASAAYARGYLGMILGDRGAFPEAYLELDGALEIAAELASRSLEISLCCQLVRVQAWQGAWAACAETAGRVRRLAELVGAPYVTAYLRAAEGTALFHLGEREAGLQRLGESTAWLEAHEIKLGLSWCLGSLAEATALAGRATEASASARKALARGASGDRLGEIMAYRALAASEALGPGGLAEARRHLARGLDAARARRSLREEAITRLWAGRLARDLGEAAEARRELEAALPGLDAMAMRFYAEEARALLASLAPA